MSGEPVVVYGAGGHGKVVADILLAAGEIVIGFLDDVKPVGATVIGLPVLGAADWLDERSGTRVALGVGDNVLRARHAEICLAKAAELVTAIHPSSVVARSSEIEAGAVLMAYTVVNPDARVGRGAIINTCAVVEHDCTVGAFAHLSPNSTMGGNCHVGAFAQLGIGATMLPGTSIGDRSIVGGAALVVDDIAANTVAIGVPARPRRRLVGQAVPPAARLLTVDDPWWPRVLGETPHDIYHRPEYASVDAASTEMPMAVWVEGGGFGLLVPMLRRSIPGSPEVFDAISPYGYAGPLWHRGKIPDPDTARMLAAAFRGLLASQAIVSFLIRLHPLLDALPAFEDLGTLVEHGETVAIDLQQELATIRAAMRQTHRNEIAQAERKGVTVEYDGELANLDAFVGLYEQTMHRVGASSSYLYGRPYFEALRAQLPGSCHLFLARTEGKLAAASLFLEENGIVQYHLAAMDQELCASHAAKLVLSRAIEWARGRRNQWLHLGGGVGAKADGVFSFKAGFSPLRRRFRTLRVVADEERYRMLGGLAPADPLGTGDDYFPTYRKGAS